MTSRPEGRWLLLIHQIPPRPSYLRAKIGRRLQRLGAVALKNSVYVLPRSDQAQEDFQWVAREIAEGGGDATVCDARFVEGATDGSIEALFLAARDSDYGQLGEEARAILEALPLRGAVPDELRSDAGPRLQRLERRLGEITAMDFLGAPGREGAESLLASVRARLLPDRPAARAAARVGKHRGRTWVTRKGVHVDRMASAWLIRRFIDPEARFRFVLPRDAPRSGELRFDMFEAEFTHEGDRCTFEVLVERFKLKEPGLGAIAEIVHDIDLKDGKFGRQDAMGVERLVNGIAMAHSEDQARIDRAAAVLDDLYEFFRRKRSARTSAKED